jgi:hypothetical protein
MNGISAEGDEEKKRSFLNERDFGRRTQRKRLAAAVPEQAASGLA